MTPLTHWARRALAAIAPMASLAGPAHAAPPPAELFFKDADIIEAVLSPSGRRLAITSAKGATRVGLVVIDMGPGGQMQRLAQFSDGDVFQVRWVNEERLIFGVTDLSEGSGRPQGAPGLFSVATDGKPMRQWVRRMGKPFISNGADDRILDWNHFVLRVPALQPDQPHEEVLIAEYGLSEVHTLTPLWLNTRTGRTRSVSFDQPRNTVGWLTDENAEPRVAITMDKGRRGAPGVEYPLVSPSTVQGFFRPVHIARVPTRTRSNSHEAIVFKRDDRPEVHPCMCACGSLRLHQPGDA